MQKVFSLLISKPLLLICINSAKLEVDAGVFRKSLEPPALLCQSKLQGNEVFQAAVICSSRVGTTVSPFNVRFNEL